MDLSKFKVSDWLIVGGAVGFLIFGTAVDWIKLSVAGVSASGANAFDFFLTGTVPWLLIVAAGVVTFLLGGGVIKSSSLPWPLIVLAATALGTLLVLLRFLFPGMGDDYGEIDVGRGAGLWLSTLAAIVATVGAVMNFRAQGGTMSDLTDVDRLRGAFGRGGDGSSIPPPPPSSGQTPPPPPPPPA